MAAPTTQEEVQVSLKLLVNKETNKVLFAEVGKDFVDILCSFLTLPLATIARLVQKESSMGTVTVGCLNSLYQGAENLDQQCLQTVTNKELLLQPSQSYSRTMKLNIDEYIEPKKYFICGKKAACDYHLLSTCENTKCRCGNLMTRVVFMTNFGGGFVSDYEVTFVVTDDLIVMPNSIEHTCLGLLQSIGGGVQDPDTISIKEMNVNVTKEKVLDLLKCSLLSKSTLTDFFLLKKPLHEMSRFSPCFHFGSSSSVGIEVKLVIRKSDGKLVYVHGEKDFADCLLSFLTFPLGAVLRVLGGESCVGSIDGLYRSISNLNDKYFMSTETKNRLIDPCLASHFKSSKHILPTYEAKYRRYSQRRNFTESATDGKIYLTEELMSTGGFRQEMSLVNSGLSGYVNRAATYIVTDDLVITPVSFISAVYFLQRLGIPLDDLEQKAVTIGFNECLSIMKASLTSTTALTNALRHLLPKVKEEK